MKKLFLIIGCNGILLYCSAQQTSGKVVYERTMQMQLRIAEHEGPEQVMPKTRIDKFELNFANGQSVLKHVDEDISDDNGGNEMQIRMIAPGQDDIVYHNFETAHKVEQRDMFDKKFIVADSIRKLNWKLSDETQTLLGHVCHKATAQRMGKSYQMTMDNGKIERKEINDTNNIVAWYTPDVPVPAGPDVQGQLPGLLLALDVNNGRMVYKALELSAKADVTEIKEPLKGKKVSPEEFNKERDAMMAEMQKDSRGGTRTMRVNN